MNSLKNTSYRQRVYDSYISKRSHLDETYQARSYRRWAKAAEQRLAEWFPAELDVPILDLACGHGNCLYLLQQKGYTNLTGVDLGVEQLELAAQYAPTAKLIKDDLINFLSSCDDKYELIVCLNIIEHFAKQELFQFLDLMTNALRPGGRIIFETPNAASPWFGAVAYSDLTHEWFFTPRGLADVLMLVNLENFEARASGPMLLDLKSSLRVLVWKFIALMLSIWNIAETGSVGSGIYTRVFVASATKKKQ